MPQHPPEKTFEVGRKMKEGPILLTSDASSPPPFSSLSQVFALARSLCTHLLPTAQTARPHIGKSEECTAAALSVRDEQQKQRNSARGILGLKVYTFSFFATHRDNLPNIHMLLFP